ncbi:ABC transporter substrate-binding protein [Alkalibaculum sp. M08DMB]|uniref:ABC transporter substrate-binding protein n=1 Tax=Alkalibaculum sporogenes TaxID=2655001 RepID=A0A6A7K752_9FIRM|nr:ABC transporter substrate-binding protein [Alkalibaculum sporogenes]MPW24953.1 ABC transporter substrate-binding protein [Alkalibaculum sporogenes]
MKKRVKTNIALFLIITVIIFLSGCGASIEAGSYTGTATGYHGDIQATTEVDQDGKIINISIAENTETEGIGTIAIEKIPEYIIEAQSLDVDVVSGATVTSNAIIDAVADSLEKAGTDLSNYGYTAEEVKSEEASAKINKDTMPEKKQTTDTITITDVKNREVTINLPISSYAISTMDVIDYIIPLKGEDAFNMLVGSGQDGGGGIQKYEELYAPIIGDYAEHLGQISDHNSPFDLEMILSMDPDVIIVNSAMAAHRYALEVEDLLSEAGIEIVLIDVPGEKMDKSVQQTMKLLGQIFQEEEKATEVSDFVDKQYELIASKNLAQRKDKPTVYYEKSGYSEIYGSTATSDSGWGFPIAIAGGDNIADEILLDTASSSGSSNTLDPEYVIKADPDYIFLSGINDGWLDSLRETSPYGFDIINRTGWINLKAVNNGNLYEFAHATNRSIYAFYPCLEMAKILYPDEFSDIDPEEILNEFFDKFMLLDSDITTWLINLEDIK